LEEEEPDFVEFEVVTSDPSDDTSDRTPSSEDEISRFEPPDADGSRENETMWHRIRQFLLAHPPPPYDASAAASAAASGQTPTTPAGAAVVVVPYAICQVCQTRELSVLGLPPAFAGRGQAYGRRRGMVLICGHVMCEICWRRTERRALRLAGRVMVMEIERRAQLRCPFCRQLLDLGACLREHAGGTNPPRAIPGEGQPHLWREVIVPGTIPNIPEGAERNANCFCSRTVVPDDGSAAPRPPPPSDDDGHHHHDDDDDDDAYGL